jgi:SAM-dependent methyltransferase
MTPTPTRKPCYGQDGPPVLRNLLLAGVVFLAGGLTLHLLGTPRPAGLPLRGVGLIGGTNFLLVAVGLMWYSRFGKLRARERFLNRFAWRGDERVLDVGCGRGLLLNGAAARLTTGKAVGVDLWQGCDLSGNGPEATRENARREGVADRVEVLDGNACQLPFPDASFDVILSNLVLHNIPCAADRARAVREMARVLKPGGRLAVVDIGYTRAYARTLRECGLHDASRARLGLFTLLILVATWGSVRPYRVTATRALVSDVALPAVSATPEVASIAAA